MYGIVSFRDSFTIDRLSSDIQVLKDALHSSKEVIVDISEVSTIDCAALQMLAAAKKECLQKGVELIIKKTKTAASMIKTLGMDL